MTRVLRIMVSVDPRGGGPMEGVARISEAWKDLGHVHDVATMDPPDAPFLKDFPGTVIPLGPPGAHLAPGNGWIWERFGYTPGAVRWLKQGVKSYDAAIVSGLWNYGTMAARLSLVGSGVPYFVFTHGMLDPWERKSKPRKHQVKKLAWLVNEGVLLRNAESVLFTSEDEMLRSRDVFRPRWSRGRVVSYGTADAPDPSTLSDAAFLQKVPQLGQKSYFLFLSRIHPKKACDLLLRSFSKYASEMPDVDLVMAGPDQIGWKKELEALARTLGIADRVHWPGMLKGEEKWAAFYGATAFVLPSHHENFGIVVAEAMACGKPVLISDQINIWREIAADGAGIVESDDGPGVDRLFKRFLALSEEERNLMGQCARRSFLSRFHIQQAARSLLDVVQASVGSSQ